MILHLSPTQSISTERWREGICVADPRACPPWPVRGGQRNGREAASGRGKRARSDRSNFTAGFACAGVREDAVPAATTNRAAQALHPGTPRSLAALHPGSPLATRRQTRRRPGVPSSKQRTIWIDSCRRRVRPSWECPETNRSRSHYGCGATLVGTSCTESTRRVRRTRRSPLHSPSGPARWQTRLLH
jgi:hypothetical protein